jgi:adenine phosphoribosyltransferase
MSDGIDLKAYIRDVPDFPAAGVLFRDVTPLLKDAEAFRSALDGLTAYVESLNVDAIVGVESRGFLFATPVAARLGLPFVPIRKPGKLPAARMSVDYSLEYGTGRLDIHEDAIEPGQRVVIVDDLLATGGTAVGSAKLVELLQGRVAGMAFVIELVGLGGRQRLEGYDIHCQVAYK